MNSYWVEHAVSEKHCETTKSLKIGYLFNISQEKVESYQDLGHWRTKTTRQQRLGRSETHGYWMCTWIVAQASTHLRFCWRRTFWAHTVIKIMLCDMCDFLRDIKQLLPVMNVAIQLIIQMCTSLLHWRLNLTLQFSQGSASTCFTWSGQFRHSFVKGLFRNSPANFYWNRFIFDRQGAKNKLAQFFETRCSFMTLNFTVKFQREDSWSGGAPNKRGVAKIRNFQPISRRISETVQDRTKVTIIDH